MWKSSSPFYERPEDPRAQESREADVVSGVQKTASIPHDVLEDWINRLEVMSDAPGGEEATELSLAMRSYFPG